MATNQYTTVRAQALARAFMDHELASHGVVDPMQPPEHCMDDVARRYDNLRLTDGLPKGEGDVETAIVLQLAAMVLMHRELSRGPVTLSQADITAFENAAVNGGGVQPTLGDNGDIQLNPVRQRFDA